MRKLLLLTTILILSSCTIKKCTLLYDEKLIDGGGWWCKKVYSADIAILNSSNNSIYTIEQQLFRDVIGNNHDSIRLQGLLINGVFIKSYKK